MPDLDALKNTPDFSNLQKLDFSNCSKNWEKSTGERLKESGSTPNTGRTGQMSQQEKLSLKMKGLSIEVFSDAGDLEPQ